MSQRRSEFLPTISTKAQVGTRSFNTASMGIDVPTTNPDGEVRGPVRSLDMRAQISQRLFDVPAVLRWPNGLEESWETLDADKFHTLKEGSGHAKAAGR